MADIEVPVLIVGGSLVGMSTALVLGHHGIRSLTVEHHRRTAIHPRAAMITQRTMEILRETGIEQVVMKKSDEQFVQDGAIMALESLAGKEIAWFIPNLNEGVRDISPSVRLFITQSLLEPLLQSRAQELGAELRPRRRWFRSKKIAEVSGRLSASGTRAIRPRFVRGMWLQRTAVAARCANASASACAATVCFQRASPSTFTETSRHCCAGAI